jgi:hypothetical protein
MGAQVCQDDGTFGECSCNVEPDAAVETNTRTFHFTGHLTLVDDQAGATAYQVNDTFSGSYTYDLLATDSNTDDTVGDYNFSMAGDGLTVTLDGDTFQTDPSAIDGGFYIEVVNRDASSGDGYLVDTRHVSESVDWVCGIIRWQLDDADGTALSSDALPDTAPNLADYTQPFGFEWDGCSDSTATPADCIPGDILVRGVVDTVGP